MKMTVLMMLVVIIRHQREFLLVNFRDFMGAMALKSFFFFGYFYKIPGSGSEFNIPQGPGDHVSTDDEDVDDVCSNHDDEQQNNLD